MRFPAQVVAIVITSCIALAAPPRASGDSDAALAAARFDPATLHEVRIEMHGRDWALLQQNYLLDTYYPADVVWDGATIRNVGVRSRGSGSRDPRKPALKIDFNEFVDGQEFADLKGFTLDNFRQDPAMMKEVLTMQLYARLGIHAPRAVHARVYVNGAYLGLYGAVEIVDKSFLDSRLSEDDGYLYDFEWDGDYRLTWLGGDPLRYATMFKPETREDESPTQLWGTVTEMITALNHTSRDVWPQMLERYFDIDHLTTYLAVETFLSEHDGLAGDWGINNFYLYRRADSERFLLIPWDKDVNFREVDRSVYAGMEGNALLETAMNYPRLKEAYHAALRRCVATATEVAPGTGNGWLELEIVRLSALIRDAAREDTNKAFDDARFEQEIAWMFSFAQQRPRHVLGQAGVR